MLRPVPRPWHLYARCQWVGQAEVHVLRDEVERLEKVARHATGELSAVGDDGTACRLEREMRGHKGGHSVTADLPISCRWTAQHPRLATSGL
jgi:hypothetical protein